MKYSVSNRQSNNTLAQADEIFVRYEDRDRLIYYIKNWPNKRIVLFVPKEAEELNWDIYELHEDFYLCLEDLRWNEECKKHNVKFFWNYPAYSWYEFNSLIAAGASQILIDAPLSFEIKRAHERYEGGLRICANGHPSAIPRASELAGTWVRPEDVSLYEPYIDTFVFWSDGDLSKERTLLHIYKDNKKWPGNLNLLIDGLNISVDNRAIPEGFGAMRIGCAQRCMVSRRCRFCETAIEFANSVRCKHFKDNKIRPSEEEEST